MSYCNPFAPSVATPLLVGECNPYSDDPEDALLPYPTGSAGARLRAILDLSEADYLARFRRTNLCRSSWSLPAARVRAHELASERHTRLVLLGARVAAAFRVDFRSRCWLVGPLRVCGATGPLRVVAVLPHPSGRSRLWASRHRVLTTPRRGLAHRDGTAAEVAREIAGFVRHCFGRECNLSLHGACPCWCGGCRWQP